MRNRTPSRTIRERFFEKVDITPGCWLWTASRNSSGYGQMSIPRMTRPVGAHRVSWELHYGCPGTQHVLHKCDTPACVNPDHLFLGTHGDNMGDMATKGRAGQRRLSEEQTVEIQKRRDAGELLRVLAAEYKVCESSVSNIGRRGKNRSKAQLDV